MKPQDITASLEWGHSSVFALKPSETDITVTSSTAELWTLYRPPERRGRRGDGLKHAQKMS